MVNAQVAPQAFISLMAIALVHAQLDITKKSNNVYNALNSIVPNVIPQTVSNAFLDFSRIL